MKPEFVAKIVVAADGNTSVRGTGYPIAKNLLVTCLHVVDFDGVDRNADLQISWPSLPDPDDQDSCLKRFINRKNIIFRGDNSETGCDIALLECSLPREMNAELPFLHSGHQPLPVKWDSKGYPKVCGNRDELKGLCSVSGRFEQPGTGCILELNTNTDTSGDGWAGLSGAPVFAGNRLVGIIANTNPEIRNQLEAVFLPYLIDKDPEFKKKIGIHSEADFSGAIEVLKRGDAGKKACRALAAQLACDQTPTADALVAHLKAVKPLGKLLAIIHEALQQHDLPAEARELLKEFTCAMLPKLFDEAEMQKIKRARGDATIGLVTIPYALEVSAEMLMAGVDGRKADVQVVPISELAPDEKEIISISKFRLAPESGGSIQDQIEDMVQDFSNTHGRNPVLPFMEIADDFYQRAVPAKPPGSLLDNPQALKLVQHYSQRAVEKNRGYYWLFILPKEEENRDREKYLELVQIFREKLPHITVLALKNDQIAFHERTSYYDTLRDVLSYEK